MGTEHFILYKDILRGTARALHVDDGELFGKATDCVVDGTAASLRDLRGALLHL
jgi:hypothetical protein